MMNLKDSKSTLIVLGIVIGLLLAIIIPILISSKNKEEKTNFPEREVIKIGEKDVVDVNSESYKKIKSQLEKDPYFAREAMISNYNYKNYTSADLETMLWNFIFSYSLTNKKQMSNFDSKNQLFCLRRKNVIDAFNELYNVNITENIDYLEGYIDYVSTKSGRLCFEYGNVAKDYNNDLLVSIDGIAVNDNVITTNLYLYEYYTTYSGHELDDIERLKEKANASNYKEAQNIVVNNLKGKVTHKQLQFYILNNGKHFKYQILVSKNLEY